jgi:predicted nuclease with TOPRIM domain
MMNESGKSEIAAIKLAELSREIGDLENGRIALLNRLDHIRAKLLAAGQRTAAMRASVDLLCEHATNVASAIAELRAMEEEMRELGEGLEGVGKETSALLFESDGLQDTIDEADDELDRLSAILIEGKIRHPRGH